MKRIFYQLILLFVITNSYSMEAILFQNGYDTMHVVLLQNKLYQSNKVIVLDIKNIESNERHILLKYSRGKYLICNLDQDDFNGFAIDYIKEVQNGFEISIEYGSRIYWNKIFCFVIVNKKFYLQKIKLINFDKFKPGSSFKQVKNYNILIDDKFNILNYLNN